MRVIALEEHISLPEFTSLIPEEAFSNSGKHQPPSMKEVAGKLADIDGERIRSMDENGISMQVLSVVGPGADLLEPGESITFASKYNDSVAAKINEYPTHFAAFAHLPLNDPAGAAGELKRVVEQHGFVGTLLNGLTTDEFLDEEKFAPLLEAAETLDVPFYLHPGLPPKAVREAYYSNLPPESGDILSLAGWGWHSETAIHILRLIISGTFDKYPKLKIIIGHMGEMLPMMMARCDTMFKPGAPGKNSRSVSQTLRDQVYITTSGIFTLPPFKVALETFGIDNILFSVDYPFAKNEMGKKFLESLDLSDDDLNKLTHGNAEKILKL